MYHKLYDYQYYYSRSERQWMFVMPDGDEGCGGKSREQVIFFIEFLNKNGFKTMEQYYRS